MTDADEPFVVDDSGDADAPPTGSQDGDGANESGADELDALRIRRLATERRATYRARSYCVIAACGLAVSAAQLVWMAVQSIRASGWTMPPVGYLLFAIAAVWGVIHFLRKAKVLHVEAKRNIIPDPASPPDFTTLDDGSKRWKNLEELR